ncbi:hypothetical protein AMECASPLE_003598 [Ameca splendens]|uniref:Uncharacterized protein n=1 Tax=Ameca splendens TaxID=208324 RepID=A0ABV0XYL1_9TELE
MSVLEPGGLDGCRMHHRVSVEDTAKAAGCLYAQNGGFFNTQSGECLGNVVSSGRLVRESVGVQNAQFGIRSDGTLVFGVFKVFCGCGVGQNSSGPRQRGTSNPVSNRWSNREKRNESLAGS